MRGGIAILLGVCAVGLALAACADDSGGEGAADSPQETVTVTVPADSQSKEEARAGDSSKRTATDKPPAADRSQRTATKSEPAPQSSTGTKGSEDSVPTGEVEATNDSPPEVTLAVIDEESASVKKSIVRRYAGLLDRLERVCEESRAQLAEAALTASHATKGTKSELSILDVLREVVASRPSGQCVDAFGRVT